MPLPGPLSEKGVGGYTFPPYPFPFTELDQKCKERLSTASAASCMASDKVGWA
ncbi:MAG: hypothetical protein H6R19_2428 [Proteobacteria bacterium]|nr:hypothetical protein [Pseudomonadota bacterium]